MASVAGSYDTRCMLTALVDEIVMPNYVDLAGQASDVFVTRRAVGELLLGDIY